jgi:uncharacterized membrane protein
MKPQTQKIFLIMVSIAIFVSLILWAISTGDTIILATAIITVIALTVILTRKEEKITVDERIQLINEKASTLTVKSFILVTSLLGYVLLALGNSGYAELSPSGFTLIYSSCALMILNTVFGTYYRRKYGG